MIIKFGTGDSWGFAAEYYHQDRALSLLFLHWYVIIEKDWSK